MAEQINDPLIGLRLGAYQLVEKLGQGGIATVLKVKSKTLF